MAFEDTPEWEWARRALAEGVPAVWVAESVSIGVKGLRKVAGVHGVSTTSVGFRSVLGHIRGNPALLKLHEEFQPRGTER